MPRPKGKKPVAFEDAGKEEDIKVQQQIPELASPRNLEIEKKAKSYLGKMRSRKAAGELEKEAKDALIVAMASAGEVHYKHGNITVDLGEKKTLKVQDENSSDDDD